MPSEATELKDDANQNCVLLLARLAIDSQAGFDVAERERAIRACCRWEMADQKRSADVIDFSTRIVAQTLLTADKGERLAITQRLVEAAQEFQVIDLDLRGTGLSDAGPLAGLRQLRTLDLRNTGVSDIGPLAGLGQLWELNLNGTGVSDVGPLAGLGQLHTLGLCDTGVNDLAPLAGVKALSHIFVNGKQKVRIPESLEKAIHWVSG